MQDSLVLEVHASRWYSASVLADMYRRIVCLALGGLYPMIRELEELIVVQQS